MTVRDLIKSSLRLIGVLSSGSNPSADESSDALLVLNGLLESWSTQRLLINSVVREQFSLTGSKSIYLMAPIAIEPLTDFNSTRPNILRGASIKSSGNELPLKVLTHDEWILLTDKDSATGTPNSIYVEGVGPVERVHFYPTPSQIFDVVLYSQKDIAYYSSLNDEILLPSGYTRALRYNLAIELGIEYGKELNSLIYETAKESKAELKRINSQVVSKVSDASVLVNRRRFDIISGGYL